ncbi:hypothetical protein EDO6_05747 [Paenibacillus xylanexedens]|nr:hypothetical protein EDO6_05747 [Paenibacillus xylanexedens]
MLYGQIRGQKGERLLKSLYNEMIHTRKGLDYAQISIS